MDSDKGLVLLQTTLANASGVVVSDIIVRGVTSSGSCTKIDSGGQGAPTRPSSGGARTEVVLRNRPKLTIGW